MICSDLSAGYRVLFLLLLGLIVFGVVTLFISMPGGNVTYAVLGLAIFGGYTVLDFNRMRSDRAGHLDLVTRSPADAVPRPREDTVKQGYLAADRRRFEEDADCEPPLIAARRRSSVGPSPAISGTTK